MVTDLTIYIFFYHYFTGFQTFYDIIFKDLLQIITFLSLKKKRIKYYILTCVILNWIKVIKH